MAPLLEAQHVRKVYRGGDGLLREEASETVAVHEFTLAIDGETPSFTTIAGGSRLYYSEIAASEISADGRGNNGIADLGFVAEISGEPTPQAKLSCQQQAASECSLAWLGQSAPSALFLRR